MSIRYRDRNGAETVVGGLTPGGDLAFGASTTRSGTVSIPSVAGSSSAELTVTFYEPLPRDDYEVELHGTAYFNFGRITNKTENGFTVTVRNTTSSSYTGTLDYYAFLLYDVEHAEQNASDIADIKAKIPSTASASNQLATSKQVNDLGTALDERIDDLEEAVPVDVGVQNKLVSATQMTTALNAKQDTLTFDSAPTAGSNNPVTSGGIKDTIDDVSGDIWNVIDKNGAKNLLPNRGVPSATYAGVTFTKNADGGVLINGTATAYTIYNIFSITHGIVSAIENKDGLLVSALGNGIALRVKDTDGNWYGSATKEEIVPAGKDIVDASITVGNGTVVDNVVVYPMLRSLLDADSTYQPYAMTNQQITPYVQAISNPNLLDNPWFTINQRGQSSYTGATGNRLCLDRWRFTTPLDVVVNSDSTITITNTQTSGSTWFAEQFSLDERGLKDGEVVTQSIMLSNGIVYSHTAPIPNGAAYDDKMINENGIERVRIQQLNGRIYHAVTYIKANSSVTVRAVKLERGSVSTLAMDTAPNYTTELLKCQRYFNIIKSANNSYKPMGYGYNVSTSSSRIAIPLSVPMRANPNVIISDVSKFRIYGEKAAFVSSFSVIDIENNIVHLDVTTDSAVTQYGPAFLADTTLGEYISFSADL